MAESHQAAFARFHPLDEPRDAVDRADLLQHAQHRFVGAAVQRTVERRRRARHRRIRIDVRAADAAHGARAAVLLVVSVQDEEDVERALEHRAHLVFELGPLEQHVQEVAREAQLIVRIHVRPADAVAIGIRGNRRHLGDEAVHLLAARRLLEDLLGVGIEGRERADGAQEDAHRVRVVLEAFHQLLDVLVQQPVRLDVLGPLVELLARRQLAEEQQIRHLEVVRALRQLLDRIAAILEDPLVAVDVGNSAAARRSVHERRIVGDESEVVRRCLDLLQVHGANRAVLDRQLVLFAGAVVDDGERVLHRGCGCRGRRVPVSCDAIRHGFDPGSHRRATVPAHPSRDSPRRPIAPGLRCGIVRCRMDATAGPPGVCGTGRTTGRRPSGQ